MVLGFIQIVWTEFDLRSSTPCYITWLIFWGGDSVWDYPAKNICMYFWRMGSAILADEANEATLPLCLGGPWLEHDGAEIEQHDGEK